MRWLHRFAVLTALATLVLLAAGGLVTSHGVGMAVPDWPNTYGYNMFAFPFSQWVGGIFFEHSHRLIAAFVGLLTTILAVWLWCRETRAAIRWSGILAMATVILLMGIRQMPVYVALACAAPIMIVFGFYRATAGPGLRWLGVIALAAVILQGVLGGLRVVWLKDEIGILHAALAQLFFVLVSAIALLTSHWWRKGGWQSLVVPSRVRRLMTAATVLIFAQLIIGATMRHQHAGLAIPDFPLAYGKLWPAMDVDSVARYNQQRLEALAVNPITSFQIGLQMAHRLLAFAIACAVIWSAVLSLRISGWRNSLSRLTVLWAFLILAQAGLGAATIWTNKAADVATAHVVLGAISLVTGAFLTLISFRGRVFAPNAPMTATTREKSAFAVKAAAA
jgi:cytochrome c oxidase assembly protein subunit 15